MRLTELLAAAYKRLGEPEPPRISIQIRASDLAVPEVQEILRRNGIYLKPEEEKN